MADGSGFNNTNLVQEKLIQNENSCRRTITKFDQRIGFTFLVFQNDSDETLTDVQFQYHQNYDLDRFTRDLPDLREYLKSRDLQKVAKAGSPVANLIEQYGAAAETKLTVNAAYQFYVVANREGRPDR